MKQKPYKFVVRLPMEMRGRIVESAGKYRRSINSEIIARLEQSFSQGISGEVSAPLHPHLEYMLRSGLDDQERRLLDGFRRLERRRQQALLDLIS